MAVSTSDLRERVRRLPGMERLLPALAGLPATYLVGGAVRDLLRGAEPLDLDLAVEGDARAAARALADRLGREVREYGRFGTAILPGEPDLNLATTRSETYERPGALPVVEDAPLSDDLRRRDFTLNAMAIGLSGDRLGHLTDTHGGLDDLRAGLLRVLHDRSFLDDPTRLLRALRYQSRLGAEMDPDTERLALSAVEGGALATVSTQRAGDALIALLGEPDVRRGAELMRAHSVDGALHAGLVADPELVAAAAQGAEAIAAGRVAPVGVRALRARAALAALCSSDPQELDLWLADLGLPAAQRDAVGRAARVAPRLATELRGREHTPSELASLLRSEPPEALALAMALRAPSDDVLRWTGSLNEVVLEIGGDDLVAAGIEPGPAIGRALDETLAHKLDGLVGGRDAELELALRLAREGA